MKNTIRAAAALTGFLAAGILQAGAQCRLKGQVIDATGAPIEGVSVVITTPSLSTFKMTVKTDAHGAYGALLPDCTMPYHMSYEKEGFGTQAVDKKIAVGDNAEINMKLGKLSEVKGAAPAAAPSVGDQAILSFNAGVEALNAGDKAAAETKFLEATRKNPDIPAAWQALCQISYEKKDWAKALEYGQKAVDLDPSQTQLYSLLSDAAKNAGDKKAAADWAARYAEANPDSPEILYNKGIEAYNKGKMKDAVTILAKAVEAKPDFANAHFYLGMAAFNQNNKAEAREHLEKYLELEPNGKEAGTAKEILPLLK